VPTPAIEALNRLVSFAARQHSVFVRADARRYEVSNKVLRIATGNGRLHEVAPGVFRVAGSQATWEQRLMIATCAGARDSLASRRAAAALHGFDGFVPGIVEITTSQNRYLRRSGVVSHTTSLWLPGDAAKVRRIPCTDPIRTFIDLGDHLSAERHEEVLDGAERDKLIDRDDLAVRLEAIRIQGRNGVRRTESVLVERESPGRTPTTKLERAFKRLLVRYRLPMPECQVPVLQPDGTIAFVDFLWVELLFGVETDGHRSHTTRRQRAADNTRQSMLQLRDIDLVRFTYDQVTQRPDAVAAELELHFARRHRLLAEGRLVVPDDFAAELRARAPR